MGKSSPCLLLPYITILICLHHPPVFIIIPGKEFFKGCLSCLPTSTSHEFCFLWMVFAQLKPQWESSNVFRSNNWRCACLGFGDAVQGRVPGSSSHLLIYWQLANCDDQSSKRVCCLPEPWAVGVFRTHSTPLRLFTQIRSDKCNVWTIYIIMKSHQLLRHDYWTSWASQVALMVKNPPARAGDKRDSGSVPGWGRSPGGGNGNPLQYSCLKNPMDRGAWWVTVLGVTKCQTQLKWLSTHAHLTSSRGFYLHHCI